MMPMDLPVFCATWSICCFQDNCKSIIGTNHHCGSLHREVVILPLMPVYPFVTLFITKVKSVEVYVLTLIVPPGAFVGNLSTAAITLPIVVPIFSSIEHPVMVN